MEKEVSEVSSVLKITGIVFVYLVLFLNAYIMHDSLIALVSAFCGITYTLLAGKGNPLCYFIGLCGSAFYIYLAFINNFWGNCLLYALYFLPMQIIGFFRWNKNLKTDKYEIIKTSVTRKENISLLLITSLISVVMIFVFAKTGDSNPVADSLTAVFSILGMYYTVRRAIEQWFIWAGVNFVSLIMWVIIAIQGEKVYSTVLMWFVYFVLALYFYASWKKELSQES